MPKKLALRMPAQFAMQSDVASELTKVVGQNVRRYREASGLSQYALAERAGVHRNTVANLELGSLRSLNLETLEQIARALGVGVDDLLRPPVVDSGLDQSFAEFLASPMAEGITEEERRDLWLTTSSRWRGMGPPNIKGWYHALELLRSERKRARS